jgi:hypothetical protein
MRTERLELFQSNLELIEELALIEQLLAAEKAKEAEVSLRTCKQTCCLAREYTDGSGSGSGSKKNYGFCSSKCRAAKKAPRKCELLASTGGCQKGKCQGVPSARDSLCGYLPLPTASASW